MECDKKNMCISHTNLCDTSERETSKCFCPPYGTVVKCELAAKIFIGISSRHKEPGYSDDSAVAESLRLATKLLEAD